MKLKLYSILLCALVFGFAATSCSDDDKNDTPEINHSQVPEVVAKAFEAQFPDVNTDIVTWEVKGKYHVAEFNKKNSFTDTDAWFDTATGAWCMTESHYGEDLFMVPAALNLGFVKSEYGLWDIDDIVYYEYPESTKDFYLFEVEKTGEPDTAVYFDSNGTQIKTGSSENLNITPDTVIYE